MMDVFALIKQERFIALIRHVSCTVMEDVVKALYAGGIRIVEVTFNPSDPQTMNHTSNAIKIAIQGGMITGAGTVLSVRDADAAYEAGACFIVSPNTNHNVVKRTKKLKMLSIPGAYTPNEIVNAYNLGADIVKIFPVLPHQIDYIKVITSSLSHIPFMITGGINPDTIAEFLNSSAIAVAAGASIIKPELVNNKNWNEISRLAEMHLTPIQSLKGKQNV
ncbi:MAG: hypothetical protein A2096_17175 [Spirochaetes bacterium GWF1_41_5]|nr:MAG: hypothetical protein A2096_17175 [Spirochaetes bacterium GWF1_41_5]HBE01901.1 2-dehydro-3-deoxyphosphogluconate aldolase [Spirochaetia bacterium]